MQTDIFLQKTLVEVVKEELKGYVTLNNGEIVEFNVYPQNLPAKKGKNDEDHFPYVLGVSGRRNDRWGRFKQYLFNLFSGWNPGSEPEPPGTFLTLRMS